VTDVDFSDNLGTQITRMDGDGVDATLVVTDAMKQPYGILHGGVHATLVEGMASIGAHHWLDGRGQVVGVSNHTNFHRSTREGTLSITARPVHRGRSQQVWAVEIRDEQERLVSNGEVRLANIYEGVR
jgi:1,4-dihydroxy-2-naphthoyl-CoA hydrolase